MSDINPRYGVRRPLEEDKQPCKGENSNVCVGEGCYGEACLRLSGSGDEPAERRNPEPVKRVDKYHITVNTTSIVADIDLEDRIRRLMSEQRANLRRIFGDH